MIIHGIKYLSGAIVRLRIKSGVDDPDPFTYCVITDILVYAGHKVFCLEPLKVVEFCEHLRAFRVLRSSEEKLVALFENFYWHGVLHLKRTEE